jgi:heme/copper-type cytochrome/quinol oxidase subunit 1
VVVVAALLLGAICVVTTVFTSRSPGMWLDWVPMFAWAWLVTGVMLLVTLPVLIADLLLLYVDHRYGSKLFGGATDLGGYLHWVTAQPQNYLYYLPALGVVADVLPSMAGARQPRRIGLLFALALGGLVGFGAFAQQMFHHGVTDTIVYRTFAIVGVVPPLVVLALAGSSVAGRRMRIASPLVWATIAGLVVLGAGAAGVLTPWPAFDLLGTAYEMGQFNLALLGAALGGLAGVVYWGPRLWGRRLPEAAPILLALGALAGVALITIPDLIAGFIDQPFGSVDFQKESGTALLNVLEVAGFAVLLLVVLGFALLALRAFSRGERCDLDPWDATTLEWAEPVLAEPGVAAVALPAVESPEPLLDRKLDALAGKEA